MNYEFSERLKQLPPYLFVEIDKAKRKARQDGRDLIDFGVGDPDLPTPGNVIAKLKEAASDPQNHKYALDQGMPALRQAIADWYKKRFNVDLEPQNEILPLIGSKEGITHMPLAFVNPGDYVLCPNPSYPPYRGSTILAGGQVFDMPLLAENSYLPDFKEIPLKIKKNSRLMFLNYPNNPTGACSSKEFYLKALDFAYKYGTIIASDAAYSETAYENYKPMSFLEIDGAKGCSVEFHSLSKTYNMTGWRIGWVCGNADVISGITRVKSNIDSGIFGAIQVAGIEALCGPQEHIQAMNQIYQERRDILCEGLKKAGLKFQKPMAAFYVWVACPPKLCGGPAPGGCNSAKFASFLLEECGVVVTPGAGFGKYGEGYIRFALTVDKRRIVEAIERIKAKL